MLGHRMSRAIAVCILGYLTMVKGKKQDPSPLSIGLSVVTDHDDVTVVVSVTNAGCSRYQLVRDPYSVLTNEYDTAKFEISHHQDSQRLEAQGVKVVYDLKYGIEVEDFVNLEPNQTIYVNHKLANIYDFSLVSTGAYNIHLATTPKLYNLDPVSKKVTSVHPNIINVGRLHISHNLVASARKRLSRRSSRVYGRQDGWVDAQYFGCGGGRKQIVDIAKEKAQQNVNAARRYLHNNVSSSKGPIYKKYLGSYSRARLEFVQNRFSDIYGSFYSNTRWYCNCTGSAVSYTVFGVHNEWHLCKGFWNAPTENTAARLGKWGIVMRDDFLFDVHGVQPGIPLVDMSQGEAAVIELAQLDANSAILNAESNTRFAGAVPPIPE